MARVKAVRAPTAASLPNHLRLPSSTSAVVKSLGRLSRQALLELALNWLDEKHVQEFRPFLEGDENDRVGDDNDTSPYNAAKTIEEVREAYRELQDRKGGKKEVIERILEGDWRQGITLRQLAMADLRYLNDHPASLRWTALELTRLSAKGLRPGSDANSANAAACVPRVHAANFLNHLQREISSLVKAHYHIARAAALPLTFLRILVTDSPYQYPRQSAETLADSSRVLYVAFPDSCPFIYTSMASSAGAKPSASHSATTDTRSLRRIVGEAIPKALSQPHARYGLRPTSLTAKSLPALLALRGNGRSNSANGAFSIFADAVVEGSPLDPRPSDTVVPDDYLRERVNQNDVVDKAPTSEEEGFEKQRKRGRPSFITSQQDVESSHAKKRKLAVHARFGTAGTLSSAPLDRLDVRLLDTPNADLNTTSRKQLGVNDLPTQSTLSLNFNGTDIISGIRKLAELGIIDPERMPSWMTGEEGVSVATVFRGQRTIRDSG